MTDHHTPTTALSTFTSKHESQGLKLLKLTLQLYQIITVLSGGAVKAIPYWPSLLSSLPTLHGCHGIDRSNRQLINVLFTCNWRNMIRQRHVAGNEWSSLKFHHSVFFTLTHLRFYGFCNRANLVDLQKQTITCLAGYGRLNASKI